jgi:enoyl-CoA hydratase/carnithine racemase
MSFRSERHGHTAVWVVDRPQARNAIDEQVLDGFEAAVTAAEADSTLRAAVLTGEGDAAFIAGADLKLLRSASPEARSSLDGRMYSLLARIEALPFPVIAALNGVVMGGGAEVALACDLRVAETDAAITFKQAAMAVTPGWGGLGRLASLVGRGTASKLLFTAQPMKSDEALRCGLYDEVVANGLGKIRALELADTIAENSPGAIADMKRLLTRVYRDGALASASEERSTFLARAQSADHAEALAAFFERRAPKFEERS